jgi:predicted RNA-binding Zn-ribbon protein involved in translation (DUF1610 family)
MRGYSGSNNFPSDGGDLMTDRWMQEMDDYLDALSAGRVEPEREIRCPRCGGLMHVRAQEVGQELRVWMKCDQCGAVNHADRGPRFPGWEALRS